MWNKPSFLETRPFFSLYRLHNTVFGSFIQKYWKCTGQIPLRVTHYIYNNRWDIQLTTYVDDTNRSESSGISICGTIGDGGFSAAIKHGRATAKSNVCPSISTCNGLHCREKTKLCIFIMVKIDHYRLCSCKYCL